VHSSCVRWRHLAVIDEVARTSGLQQLRCQATWLAKVFGQGEGLVYQFAWVAPRSGMRRGRK